MDALGNIEWNKTYTGAGDNHLWSLIPAIDGGYVLAGYSEALSFGNIDFWLLKTDAAGNMMWDKKYGGTNDEMAYALIQASESGYAIAGYTNSEGAGGFDGWVVKTDETGVVPEYTSLLVPALVLTTNAFIIINKKLLTHKRSQA